MDEPVPATSHRPVSGVTLEFVAKATLVVLLLWALANALWLARDVLFITFFALLIASFLSIFVEPLHRRGVSRALAAPLILFATMAVVAGAMVLTWPTLRSQFSLIQQQLPPAVDALQVWLDAQTDAIVGSFGDRPDADTDVGPGSGSGEPGSGDETSSPDLRARISDEMSGIIGGTLPLLNTALGAVTGFALVIVAGMFIAISPRTYMRGLIVLVPRSKRRRAGEVLPMVGVAMVQWMKGTAIGMLIVGSMSALGLWLLDVPAALALGLLAGLLEFIPYVGPALSFVPATVLALAVSPEKALWVIGLYAVIQGLESNLIMPLLMKKMVELPPALSLLFQAVMATLFGFLGLLLAVPILAAAKILVQHLYVEGVADEH